MKRILLSFLLCILCLCMSAQQLPADASNGLKYYYQNYFTMGVAVSRRSLQRPQSDLILREFASITPENAMKMGPIHPRESEYNWTDSDSIIHFAQRNNLRVRGHTLCWHSQTPSWLFTNAAGDTVSKEILLKRLKDHITRVVQRYQGKIYAWDVVNEVVSDAPGEYLRKSAWLKICGEDFIAKAFEYAHAADPKALLFYNDYNEIDPVKRLKIIKLIKGLKDKGVPIHGVGLQGHWALNEPSREQLDKALTEFAALGMNVQITELDISIYTKEHAARERIESDSDTSYTETRAAQQAAMYAMVFELFRKYKKSITGVTFWNVSDQHSWLDNFPVKNRKDYPLLFDTQLKRKKAYYSVTQFKQ